MSEVFYEFFVKIFGQLIVVIIVLFVILIILIVLFVNYVNYVFCFGVGMDVLFDEQVVVWIVLIVKVDVKDVNVFCMYKIGEEVYKVVCVICYGIGVVGVLKFGNKDDWVLCIL